MTKRFREAEQQATETVCKTLARLKSLTGYSQNQICELADVGAGQLSGYMQGKHSPSLAVLVRIVEAGGYKLVIKLENLR